MLVCADITIFPFRFPSQCFFNINEVQKLVLSIASCYISKKSGAEDLHGRLIANLQKCAVFEDKISTHPSTDIDARPQHESTEMLFSGLSQFIEAAFRNLIFLSFFQQPSLIGGEGQQ